MENATQHKVRCSKCGANNRIVHEKKHAIAKCGKCGTRLETEELFVAQPLMITEKNFDEKVLRSPLPAIVFAWAPWCPTCRSTMPVIDEYAKDAKGKIRVTKLNVDTSQALASKYHILSVPQILVFDNGRLHETLPGTLQKHELMMKMARYL